MRIESLLSARLFMAPQLAAGRVYFVSDLSGRLSLYAMDARPGGSVPELLLPPNLALQHPSHVGGRLFKVLPALGKILLMLDHDGDENYQPMFIPIAGGFPEPAFGDQFQNQRVHLGHVDLVTNQVYLFSESRKEALNTTYRGDLTNGTLVALGSSQWGFGPDGYRADHSQVLFSEGYTFGDNVLLLWEKDQPLRVLHGTRIGDRQPGEHYPLNAFFGSHFVSEKGVLTATGRFSDAYGLAYFTLDNPAELKPVKIKGLKHAGTGELTNVEHVHTNRFLLTYNIDGCSWAYEGQFDEAKLTMTCKAVLAGQGDIANGVLEAANHDEASDTYTLSYSTATSPTQLYTVSGKSRKKVARQTNERVLGLPAEWLSPGEDASFTSHDGLRISARLYLPAPALGFSGPRPLVYYIHGGPQSQERPDFSWFSMPIIQFLTLNGLAVFTPNVRGSSGYGLSYMKRVDRDWGGLDRLDHVHAMTEILPNDSRLDVKRTGVTGRSYGGYMTLTLAARHPELWSAAIDMFGPYNLFTFIDRLPETWKPYFKISVGDPEKDQAFLAERSPSTYMDQITCPLLVIQGKNDPRVVEVESRDVVERLRAQGKQVEYLVFENEGHDVLKYENKVTCYNAITTFFKKHLMANSE